MNLFVANWKMNLLREDARKYCEELRRGIGDRPLEVELVVAPSYVHFDTVRDTKSRWSLAAQNVAAEPSGAYTGEVSASMLADALCRYVIVGHSERRRLFAEDGPMLARKLARCREAGLIPIYCVGETAEERQGGLSTAVLTRQIETLAQDSQEAALVVAYEPVWAIGTGKAATPEDCMAACVHVRQVLSRRRQLRVLYGGSVAPNNAREILVTSGVDGFLIGGASLNPDSFAAIAGLP
jgi:triosephosphate isomerase (TIM)